MPAIKAEVLQRILSDANSVKPIEGTKYAYTPDDYNKIMAKNRAMGLMSGDGDYYTPEIPEGSVEFDAFGNLRKLGRTAPKMLDLNVYTQNRYMIVKSSKKMGRPRKGKDSGEAAESKLYTEILVVLGEPIVKAISAMNELPKTVKAFRFAKAEGESWEFKGAEFIEDKIAYQMTHTLAPESALKLMQLIEAGQNEAGNRVMGDSLDEIA